MWDTMWVPAAEEFRKIDGDKTRVRKKVILLISQGYCPTIFYLVRGGGGGGGQEK